MPIVLIYSVWPDIHAIAPITQCVEAFTVTCRAIIKIRTRFLDTPPEGETTLRDLIANRERFLHNQTELDPLIQMAVGHHQFEAIQPFIDGNGRT